MARLTGTVTSLTTTWVKVVDLGETFMLTVLSGQIWLAWSSASPSAGALGHRFFADDTFGDTDTTENVWVRAEATASVIMSKE